VAEKRMLIVDSEVIRKIDENRGDLNRTDFLNFLFDSQLNGEEAEKPSSQNLVTQEEFAQFAQGMKELIRNCLEFFISYGMELGKRPEDKTYEELTEKLQALGSTVRKQKQG